MAMEVALTREAVTSEVPGAAESTRKETEADARIVKTEKTRTTLTLGFGRLQGEDPRDTPFLRPGHHGSIKQCARSLSTLQGS